MNKNFFLFFFLLNLFFQMNFSFACGDSEEKVFTVESIYLTPSPPYTITAIELMDSSGTYRFETPPNVAIDLDYIVACHITGYNIRVKFYQDCSDNKLRILDYSCTLDPTT
jgi:hypothetical protein